MSGAVHVDYFGRGELVRGKRVEQGLPWFILCPPIFFKYVTVRIYLFITQNTKKIFLKEKEFIFS